MKQITVIAISGGIDSLAAAYLLKKQGHDLIGLHFVTGYEAKAPMSLISDQLGITIKHIDCKAAFKANVVDYFTRAYQAGKTPNPCIVCNLSIKFGIMLDLARQLGAVSLATGHYARIKKDNESRFHLLKGRDPAKDQSYFLAFLSQKQLAHACFPLGGMTKSEVIRLANEKGLTPVIKNESQDICFIKNKKYADFLALQPGFVPKPGLIEDMKGNIIGKHRGLHLFTIGQRRGINCPASEPYYVIRFDTDKNRLIVGFKKDLLSLECRVTHVNWINQKPVLPLNVFTRLRYRHQAVASTLFPLDNNTALIRFKVPQSAVTPGQGAVFYHNDEVLGAGWIDI